MGELLGVYVFGSAARGDLDPCSDLDLLAVVEDGRGKVPSEAILAHVPAEFAGLEPSISWYGRRRLSHMFANGELFAWHLSRETIPLHEVEPVLASLGKPSPYSDGAADIASFEAIMAGIPAQLSTAPDNAIYELGLLYVCLRNICMAASWTLCPSPDFSRYSPFRLNGFDQAPIAIEDYELAMTCRMAGQRGLLPPGLVKPSRVAEIHASLAPWVAALRRRLEG
ncbi:MAG: hypothetical protein JWO81_3259 [Alphaproteobacteria bacterium]|nr:hypothetical protein [Alphaproteobacteria bacterium]